MSSTYLIEFHDGKAAYGREYKNSWGGAARIWNSLFERHCKDPTIPHDNWLTAANKDRRLWDLAKDEQIPMFARAVHAFTFDNALVRREHFTQLARDLRFFVARYPAEGADHLSAWAEAIEASDAEAIALHATSVNENPWATYDEAADETIPYDLNTGDRHWEVYDELRSSLKSA